MELTEKESRYLKFIYRKQEEEDTKVKTTDIAEYLKVKPATVTEKLQELAKKNLLKYKSYQGVDITKRGLEEAENLLRKHRILETLFVEYLGLDKERACKEALNLDYHVTDQLVNSICKSFEHPDKCPCGRKIFENRNWSNR
ncbi:hypothetical protein AKJ52_02165 [candidate division MSBL1 archaeon SCGC-AAA382C18]|uniref:HTH dtxR-type domain-containing protein n=1 Tax=candidate division MSBL1 archaeon SCGC-AAA382C18 TaxID=1698281 RepID=A0A133VJ91_9EURY|nr:hypothetical protein AKJ52_02165 [candidate division MSBL1 archaeon SCGC-AAA382C18]